MKKLEPEFFQCERCLHITKSHMHVINMLIETLNEEEETVKLWKHIYAEFLESQKPWYEKIFG